MNKSVCIVVATHNRRDVTESFIETLLKQTYNNFKVVIIDAGSSDGTREIIKTKFSQVTLIETNKNVWWSEATNMGVDYAIKNGFDFVLTLNNDAIINQEYLSTFLKCAEKHSDSIIGSKILNEDSKTIWSTGVSVNFANYPFLTLNNFGQPIIDAKRKECIEVDANVGNGTLYPIEVFKKIGMFNFNWAPQYHGDTEFTYRAETNGIKNFVCLEVVVRNNLFVSEPEFKLRDEFLSKKSRNYWKPILLFYIKYSPLKYKLRFLKQFGWMKYKIRTLLFLNILFGKHEGNEFFVLLKRLGANIDETTYVEGVVNLKESNTSKIRIIKNLFIEKKLKINLLSEIIYSLFVFIDQYNKKYMYSTPLYLLRQRRLYFLHIPKTAGTTLNSYLSKLFSPEKVFPYQVWNHLPDNYDFNKAKKYQFFNGHFGNQPFLSINESESITMFRSPVERAISQYKHMRIDPSNWVPKKFLKKYKSLFEIIEDTNSNSIFSNVQIRYLKRNLSIEKHVKFDLKVNYKDFLFDSDKEFLNLCNNPKEIYNNAIENVEKFITFGIQEYFQESLFLISFALGSMPIYDNIRLQNFYNELNTERFTNKLMHSISLLNTEDIQFYNYSVNLFQKRYTCMEKTLFANYYSDEISKLSKNEQIYTMLVKRYPIVNKLIYNSDY